VQPGADRLFAAAALSGQPVGVYVGGIDKIATRRPVSIQQAERIGRGHF
jgi:hypothetical protein